MDLIAICPKLIPMNNEGTFFRGFVTAEVICLSCLFMLSLQSSVNLCFP